ncbi:MATE family efflux transporter [Pararobbsia silviterrae]|uniref:MATE family efflux transporter n=1 Tax=Pararobbsia silviterrae TaxID=1792498 RepID=A0A494Y824_9BURK|nr:MATE family efflux transporter [Pararobbsia silviterrae]RKP58526.1 MATE family efflux transporter [Pararobbsia silviterrae]
MSAPASLSSPSTDFPSSPGAWHRKVLGLSIPIVLANLTQPLLSAVDTAIAGHMADVSVLGGVALGGLFFLFVFWGFAFLRMGTTGLVAQAHGAGDAEALRAIVLRALSLAFAFGIVVLAVRAPLIRFVIGLLGGSPTAQARAMAYCSARIFAAPLVLANFVVLGYLLGTQHARLALLVQWVVNVANVVAVLTFVYGFGWGIAGIGAATACADAVGFVLGMALLAILRPRGLRPIRWPAVFERHAMLHMIGINRDIFVRTACLVVSFGWFAHTGAQLGDTVLAANALLLNFQTFMAYALDGFANAAEALVGAALGARHRAALLAAIRVTLIWTGGGALAFSLCYLAIGPSIIDWLTDQAAVRATARTYLPWAALSPLLSAWSFALDGMFIGATRTRDMMVSMAIAMALFLAAAMGLGHAFGNHGLWAAFMLFMIVRAVTLGVRVPALVRAAVIIAPRS